MNYITEHYGLTSKEAQYADEVESLERASKIINKIDNRSTMEIINPNKFTPRYSDIAITPEEIRNNAILDKISAQTGSYDVKQAWAVITMPNGSLKAYDVAKGIDPKVMKKAGISDTLNRVVKDLDYPNYRVQENTAVKQNLERYDRKTKPKEYAKGQEPLISKPKIKR